MSFDSWAANKSYRIFREKRDIQLIVLHFFAFSVTDDMYKATMVLASQSTGARFPDNCRNWHLYNLHLELRSTLLSYCIIRLYCINTTWSVVYFRVTENEHRLKYASIIVVTKERRLQLLWKNLFSDQFPYYSVIRSRRRNDCRKDGCLHNVYW